MFPALARAPSALRRRHPHRPLASPFATRHDATPGSAPPSAPCRLLESSRRGSLLSCLCSFLTPYSQSDPRTASASANNCDSTGPEGLAPNRPPARPPGAAITPRGLANSQFSTSAITHPTALGPRLTRAGKLPANSYRQIVTRESPVISWTWGNRIICINPPYPLPVIHYTPSTQAVY